MHVNVNHTEWKWETEQIFSVKIKCFEEHLISLNNLPYKGPSRLAYGILQKKLSASYTIYMFNRVCINFLISIKISITESQKNLSCI